MFGSKQAKIQKLAEKKNAEKLIAYLGDKSEDIRLAAIDALGQINDSDAAYNALIPFIHAQDSQTRVHAIRALGAMGNPHARVHVEHQAKNEKDPAVLAEIDAALKILHGKD